MILTNFLPRLDRPSKKIEGQVCSQLERGLTYHIRESKEKESPASGAENEPLLRSDREIERERTVHPVRERYGAMINYSGVKYLSAALCIQ